MASSSTGGFLVMVVVALGLLGPAGYLGYHREQLVHRAVHVPATVIGVQPHSDSNGSTTYSPVYSYTYHGHDRTEAASVSTSSQPHVGSSAMLLVDPQNPGDVVADTFMEKWFLPVLLGGMGAIFLLIAVLGVVLGGRRGGTSAA